MKKITSKKIEVMAKSHQNAKELASKLFVLILIARIKGLSGLSNYISPEILQGKSDLVMALPKLLQEPEPILPLYNVLGMLLGFIVKGSTSGSISLKVTTKTLMHYYDITQELEKEILLAGVIAIQKGHNPLALKEELGKILSENSKRIRALMNEFFKSEITEDKSLIALLKSESDSGFAFPMEMEELAPEEEINKTAKKNIGGELISYDEFSYEIKSLISEKLKVEFKKITDEASFRVDLGADSLDAYELVYAIEEEFTISIPDERANEFEKVINALDYCWGKF